MDHVVTAPDMLVPRDSLLCDRKTLSVWAVVEDWSVDDEAGHNEILYADKEDAARVFHSQLFVEANEGCIERWKGRSHFQSDHTHGRDDAWIALYAIYSPVYHTLQMKYYIETDTSVSEPIAYEPTKAEQKVIMEMIEEKCREVENCSCVELLLEAANDDER